MHNGDGTERHEKDEHLIKITKTLLEIKIKHLQKIRELTDEGKLKDIVDDVHETEKDILETVAVLIVLKKRFSLKTQTKLLPTYLLQLASFSLRDWCVALGISEKGGAKIVQKFETDILGFLELSNWGRNNSGAGSHAELSEESFRKQLTLIKGISDEDVRRLWHANHNLAHLIDALEQSHESCIFTAVQQLTGKNGFDAIVKNHLWSSWRHVEKRISEVESGDRRNSSESSSEASAHSPGILDNSSCSVFSPLPKAKSPEISANHSRFGRDSGLGDSQLKSFSFPKNSRKSADRLSPNSTRISENSLIDPYAEVSAKRKDGVFSYPDRPDAQSTPFQKNPKLSYNNFKLGAVPFSLNDSENNDQPSCLASYDAFSDEIETTDSVEELKNPPRTRNRSQEVQDRTSAFRNKKTAFKSMLVDWEVHFDDLILERELPGGRFGTKCHICKWHGKCVIRVAKVDLKTENPNVQAFKQELHHFKKTRHDNVELFLGACLTPPNLAILTRYYQGPRLDKKIKEESLSLDNARLLADHIINGLKYLHAKDILHKDLRPANIMYDLVGKAVIKGLGLATVSALTGVGSIRNNAETDKYYIDVPTDWIHRLSPELATIDLEKCQNSSIIPKLNYSKKSDIYAFGVLWAELMQAVHRSSQPAPLTLRREADFNSSRRVEKSVLRIDLNTPPTDNFESKLFNAGLGRKIEVPDPIQDQARCLINRCVERSATNRPDCEWIQERLDKVQPNAGRLTRRGVSSPSLIRDRRKSGFSFPQKPFNHARQKQLRRIERIDEHLDSKLAALFSSNN